MWKFKKYSVFLYGHFQNCPIHIIFARSFEIFQSYFWFCFQYPFKPYRQIISFTRCKPAVKNKAPSLSIKIYFHSFYSFLKLCHLQWHRDFFFVIIPGENTWILTNLKSLFFEICFTYCVKSKYYHYMVYCITSWNNSS